MIVFEFPHNSARHLWSKLQDVTQYHVFLLYLFALVELNILRTF